MKYMQYINESIRNNNQELVSLHKKLDALTKKIDELTDVLELYQDVDNIIEKTKIPFSFNSIKPLEGVIHQTTQKIKKPRKYYPKNYKKDKSKPVSEGTEKNYKYVLARIKKNKDFFTRAVALKNNGLRYQDIADVINSLSRDMKKYNAGHMSMMLIAGKHYGLIEVHGNQYKINYDILRNL